ncbi:UDP-N-acetylmuramate--L-alanine ligase [Thiomicrorhabdus sp. ZW0627]|uniref:UDP-N-acetylmuramate--L-alanine ligase n=1 Tax=Thiomicrorhabdus sp. ZW0627 TaxID=3039774 RepID=UPI002436A1D6|nr:UDP-N-acetylmuramate--L-alanine ligase [Thiomicrorhabdus sp. ZW0627]MDG6774039.1 UDP-N-acetylmuramate--L-alanine ligase [Thiomicrorhabdus sp. ZW0627]
MKEKVKQIHFVGIGGVGMAGIAEVCLNLGYIVSGSDLKHNPTVARLADLGALIQLGHNAEHVKQSDVVVVSTAIPIDNPEVSWAKEARIPVIPRAEMLAELMRMRFGIAIAGTHGKTTTTSLTAAVLTQGGLDPTFVIGGRLNQVGANARLGSSQYLVAEADESDASFLHLAPMVSVVTNIDEDHMETYQGDYQNLENTFIEFIQQLPFYGLAIVCLDDENVRNMLPKLTRKLMTYGFHEDADIRAINVRSEGLKMKFQVLVGREQSFDVTLNIPGLHNVQNALAAIAVGLELNVAIDAIQQALSQFGGVGRRFEVYPNCLVAGHKVTLVDDYGHHPTELTATIQTARKAFPDKRLVLVFQPHRYSRTRDLFDDFVQSLLEPDVVILTEIYAAGEAVIPTFDSKALLQAMRLRGGQQGIYAEDFEQLESIAEEVLQDDDLLLVMGAGNVGQLAKKWQNTAEGES